MGGVHGVRDGQKRPDKFGGLKGERLKLMVPSNLAAGGVVLEPAASPDGSEIVMLLPPQVGVKLEGETEFHYHTEEELTGEGIDRLPPTNEKVNIRLLAEDDAGVERIRELVLTRFPKFREEGKLDLPPPDRVDGKMLVEIKSKVDQLLARAIAKIAFNYMAFHAGAKFALSANFDPARRFIRYDQGADDWRQFI